SFGQVILPVPGHRFDLETFYVSPFGFSIKIYHMVGRAFIAAVPDISVQEVFPHEDFITDFTDLESSVFSEGNHIIDIRTFPDKSRFFEPRADETFLIAHIQP